MKLCSAKRGYRQALCGRVNTLMLFLWYSNLHSKTPIRNTIEQNYLQNQEATLR